MQNTVIIDNDGGPRTELDPVLRVCAREQFLPCSDRIVPILDLVRIQIVHDTSVVVVPSYLYELPSDWIMSEHRISRSGVRLVESRGFTRGMRWDGRARQDRVCVGMQLFEDGGNIESIDQ